MMRKFLLSTVALLMAISMMAIGDNSGANKANAIDFDWANGHKPALSTGSWYRVSLSPLKAEANDPTLALYLTNLTDETAAVTVTVEASLLGQSSSSKFNYNIVAKDYQLWSKKSFVAGGRELSLKQMMDLGLSEIYLQLTSNKEIALSAKVYETEDIVDDACSKAKDFNWAGVNIPVGEQWFRLNLSEVKNNNKKLNFVIANQGAVEANVSFEMSLDCPASAVLPAKNWTIAAGAEEENELGTIFLDVLNEDYVFVKLINDQPITMRVEEEVVVVDPSLYADFDCATAPELVFGEEMNLTAGKHVYKVKREELIAERDFDTEFYVTNNTSEVANLTVETAFACPVTSVVAQNLVINAQESVMKLVKGDMLKAVNSEWVYIRFITDKDLTASVGMRNVSPCANAVVFDWNTGAELQAGETQWYEMDITTLKQNKQHLYLAFANHSKATALVNLELAMDCQGTILPLILPVPAGFDLGQTIDYQILSRSPLNRIYVGVSTDSHIELSASTKDAIAADPTPCLNALNPEHGKEYKHAAGTTSWYKISLDLLKSKAGYSSIYLANPGNKRANVTIGMVTDCQYTTGATITLPIPAGFNLGMLAPNVIGNLVDALARVEKVYNKVDAKDVYLEIKTDQDVLFGLDVTNATTNPCLREDLITFDWNKGAKIKAGTPAWYDVDLTTIKDSGKHVKLTFTNHTDSLVWAATVVSVDCPAKLTMPLILPVPAHTCIDKFIDYHYFAVPNVDNIYVGVVADGVLEMAATTYDAVIAPSADCLNAVEVTSDFSYTQKAGSQWYKFPMGLLNDGGHAGKISLRNLGAKTATLTAGVTVGCEYAIPTYGKVKLPKELAFSLAIPTSILAKARKLIDADITEFYMQLTSDQDILVALNMDASDLKACSSAVPFDWNDWEKNGLQLQANQDMWYEVNLRYPWEKMKKGEDLVLAVTNNNNVPVEFEAAVSPTCPVFFALESYATIPSNITAQQVIPFTKLMEFLKQFDRQFYNHETELILEKYNAFVILNKIDNKLGKYGKYFPVSKLEAILDQYGQYIAYAELKNLIDNREKYLSKAEVKSRLEEAKELLKDKAQEKLSIDQAIQIIDKLDAYIPYVEVETILENYDQFLPYAAGAVTLLKKCEKYIPTDEIKQIVVKAKNAIPMDKINALFDKIEARLPRDLNCYMRIKTTGDIIVEPDTTTPVEDKCAEAIPYVWGTDIELNAEEEAWYKLSISDLRGKDCTLKLTVTNNTADSVQAAVNIYDECPVEEPYLSFAKGIAANTPVSKEVHISELPADVDVLYLYVKPTGNVLVNLSSECVVVKYKTINSYDCIGEQKLWKDTVHVNSTLDSIYTYVVNPFVPLEIMTDSILKEIWGAIPELKQGKMPHVDTAAISDYYMANDSESIADVASVIWNITKVDCDATSHTMTLVVTDICGKEYKTDHIFPVAARVAGPDSIAMICAGEEFLWYGEKYFSTGTYTKKVPDMDGCDSVVSLALTVNNPTYGDTITTTISSNDLPYMWPVSGEKYDSAGYYGYSIDLNAAGCDSIATLHLIVKDTIFYTIVDSVCDGTDYYDLKGDKHVISSLVSSTQTWSDTVVVSPTLDSIYTYVITPIVAPVKLTDSIIATISDAIPVLKQGALPVVDASVAAIKAYYQGIDTEAISDVVTVTWEDVTSVIPCDATTDTMTLVVKDECDNVLGTTFVFNVEARTVTYDTTVVACESFFWIDSTYTTSGDHVYTTTAANGCDSVMTLHLTINSPVTYDTTVVACDSYFWIDSTYTTSGDHVYTTTAANGCDSVMTLHLTILPEAKVETEEWTLCPGDLSTPREWHGQSISAAGNYEASDKFVGTDCDSVIYQLTVTIPDADNDATMDNLPAVSKYNNRVLLLNINEIKDMFDGWTPAQDSVVWYRVVGEQDAAYAAYATWKQLPNAGDDEVLIPLGHYYNEPDGSTLKAGKYYALLLRPTDLCDNDEIMRTVLLTCEADASGPRLVPNVVRPNEILTLENLQPSEVNEIRVYSSTGQLVATYTAEQVSKFIFNAAHASGYYLVDVENKNNKVTLRYVVK